MNLLKACPHYKYITKSKHKQKNKKIKSKKDIFEHLTKLRQPWLKIIQTNLL